MKRNVISVITVTFNAARTLEKTILSVIGQSKCEYEYWIIDGGSVDGTLDIINKYNDQLTGWISEADKGIYDAMNKGLDMARGEWIYFLGADDQLMDNALSIVSEHLSQDITIVYGNVKFDNGYGMVSYLSKRTLFENTLHHQSAFYNKNLFEDFRYDSNLKVSADYELNLYVYLFGYPTKHVDDIIAICGTEGVSKVPNSMETNLVRRKLIKNEWTNRILSLYITTYYNFFVAKMRIKQIIMTFLRNQV